ncbi:carbonic anhydrase [Irpex rosettiformis]|uniref:Carbonic anhydrase n=1 Tax=Irpex rosettiformis TaxID=378272 RepID=A0ACB8UIN5_9APHY|nr:carbonic anhydrase [Irpex rosettiformis]
MTTAADFPILARLLDNNSKWSSAVNAAEPAFFAQSAKGQAPKVLWIGCADSRVPESVVLAAKPGDIFVARNIANQIHLDDDNILSVLAYAIAHVGVEHIVLAGHTNCGGAQACLAAAASPSHSSPSTPLERWLAPLTALAVELQEEKAGEKLTGTELVEASVRAGLQKLLQTKPVQDAWSPEPDVRGSARLIGVHGVVYDLETGRVRDLGISVTV